MAATEGPPPKKPRRIRTIELDLANFPEWVQKADESTLIQVFALGVKVKDSFAIKVTENSEYIERILDEKLKPVYSNVETMTSQFIRNVTELQTKLVGGVHEVARKVLPLDSLNSKMDQVLRPIERCEDSLIKLVNKYENPVTKGALGETEVLTTLQHSFPTYTICHVAQGRKGDIEITPPHSDHKYLVEVKDYKDAVPTNEVNKFKRDVKENKAVKVGILFSLRSGIRVVATQGRFTINFENDQYYIYVPNALNDPQKDLIVWIVMLADQLALLNQGLTDAQTKVVADLLMEFQQNMDRSKACRTHLQTLEKSVAALKDNMEPLLTVIQNAKRKLNSALNKKINQKTFVIE